MPKKTKNKDDITTQTSDIIKKIKLAFFDVVVREWLNTPCKEWGNKTVLQMVKAGKGQEIIDSIKLADDELKKERPSKKKRILNDERNGTSEDSFEQETILSRIEGS